MSTAVIEKEKIFLNTKTQTTEPKMDDESDISYDTDSWQSLMQAKTREFHAISEAENEKKKSLYLQEKIKKPISALNLSKGKSAPPRKTRKNSAARSGCCAANKSEGPCGF